MSKDAEVSERFGALVASIAELETRIDARQGALHRSVALCRADMRTNMTSWQALVTAGVAGFLLARRDSACLPRGDVAAEPKPSQGALRRALHLSGKTFVLLQRLPW